MIRMPSTRRIPFSAAPAVVLLLSLQANMPGAAQGANSVRKNHVARSAEVLLRETPFAPVRANVAKNPALLLPQPLDPAYRDQLRARVTKGRLVHHATGRPLHGLEAVLVQMADGTLYFSSVRNDAIASITGLRPIRMAATVTARDGKISTLRMQSAGYDLGKRHWRAFQRFLASQGVYDDEMTQKWRRSADGDSATSRGTHLATVLASLVSRLGNQLVWVRSVPRRGRIRPSIEQLEVFSPFVDSQGMLDWEALDETMTTTFGRLLPRPVRAQGDWKARRSPNSAVWLHDEYVYGQALQGHLLDSRSAHGAYSPTTTSGPVAEPPLPPLFGFTDHDQVVHLNVSQFNHLSQHVTALVPTYAHRFAHERFSPTLLLAMAEHLVPPSVPSLAPNLRIAMGNLATYLGEGLIEQALFRGDVNGFARALEDHLDTPRALAHLESALGLLQHPVVDVMGVPHIAITRPSQHPVSPLH